jgi:citrate lyase beta subunit
VLPKIHSEQDLNHVSRAVLISSGGKGREVPLGIIPSIESARGMWNIRRIAEWESEYGSKLGGRLNALLVCRVCVLSLASDRHVKVCS